MFSLDGTHWRLYHLRPTLLPSGRLRHPSPLAIILTFRGSSHLNSENECRREGLNLYRMDKQTLTIHSTIKQDEACYYDSVLLFFNDDVRRQVEWVDWVTSLTSQWITDVMINPSLASAWLLCDRPFGCTCLWVWFACMSIRMCPRFFNPLLSWRQPLWYCQFHI